MERTVKSQSSRAPDRPVYLVGEAVGACIALAVAARNPDIDLVLILVNPGQAAIDYVFLCFSNVSSDMTFFSNSWSLPHLAGTSCHRSQLQTLSTFLDLVPEPFHLTTPQLLNFLTGFIYFSTLIF